MISDLFRTWYVASGRLGETQDLNMDVLTPVTPTPPDVSSFRDDSGKLHLVVWSYRSIAPASLVRRRLCALWSCLLPLTKRDEVCGGFQCSQVALPVREGGHGFVLKNAVSCSCFITALALSGLHSMGVLYRRAVLAYGLGALMTVEGLAGPLESLTRERWVPLDSTATDQVRFRLRLWERISFR